MPIRIGVIGAGVGAQWAEAFSQLPDCQVVALAAAPDDPRLGPLAEKYRIPPSSTFTGYEQLLSPAGPDLDICVVACPPHLHKTVAHAAMERGANALVEKPPAMLGADATAMYFRSLFTDTFLGWSRIYRSSQGQPPPRPYLSSVHAILRRTTGPAAPWARDIARSGGGCLADIGVHMLDLGWYLLGTPPPLAVQGHMFAADGHRVTSGCEETFCGVVEFGGGQRLSLDISWCSDEDVQRIDFYGAAATAPAHAGKCADSFYPRADEGIFVRAATAYLNALYADNRAAQLQATSEGVVLQRMLSGLYESAARGDGHGVRIALG